MLTEEQFEKTLKEYDKVMSNPVPVTSLQIDEDLYEFERLVRYNRAVDQSILSNQIVGAEVY
ncbi:MAG: hypothetical protein AABX48_00165 [Nanoarchaeota archaeon]